MLNMLPSDSARPCSSGRGRPSSSGGSREAKDSVEVVRGIPIADEDDTHREQSSGQNFFNWREIYPELELLYNNQTMIYEEMSKISRVSEMNPRSFSFSSTRLSVGSMA